MVSKGCELLDPGAVEFRRLTESNFHGVEVVAGVEFFRAAAVAFNVQFFDTITELLVFIY